MVPITRRELTKAWDELRQASRANLRTNPHRLLLFYAAECGLKAVYLKDTNADVLNEDTIGLKNHDLNQVMDRLKMGKEYRLPASLNLPSLRTGGALEVRKCGSGSLNQVWRYGSKCERPVDDVQLEATLEKVNEWIAGEIR
ncbi:hypothetical protein ACTACM_17565 [Pseudomonas fragariae (ex Marin et al. 2024)]|uniref:hypothetical protein n=1 Tax=Pseudomonas TaxID=286 RepID=UPI000467A7A8|nr:hypothetical protein [Pseudomonas syringae]MCH5510596.1 hypothetical protein [Pseudomonas syringae pv. syringae]MCH5639297.1 hypothetical protein [Pseudomonas syringae pv. syringae]MCH7428486.1 hypothetical protein [Pseudomonas syringae pv. syringae]QGG73973.1 hypothetical protein N028_00610 [Pseudomonas syringae USA011]